MKMVEVVVEDFGGIPGETVIDLHLHWRARDWSDTSPWGIMICLIVGSTEMWFK